MGLPVKKKKDDTTVDNEATKTGGKKVPGKNGAPVDESKGAVKGAVKAFDKKKDKFDPKTRKKVAAKLKEKLQKGK